jgi:hypothetical protein
MAPTILRWLVFFLKICELLKIGVARIQLAQNRVQWQLVVKLVLPLIA